MSETIRCFYCAGESEYHPTCDLPGCENQTHGHGDDGTTVLSYCETHREGSE